MGNNWENRDRKINKRGKFKVHNRRFLEIIGNAQENAANKKEKKNRVINKEMRQQEGSDIVLKDIFRRIDSLDKKKYPAPETTLNRDDSTIGATAATDPEYGYGRASNETFAGQPAMVRKDVGGMADGGFTPTFNGGDSKRSSADIREEMCFGKISKAIDESLVGSQHDTLVRWLQDIVDSEEAYGINIDDDDRNNPEEVAKSKLFKSIGDMLEKAYKIYIHAGDKVPEGVQILTGKRGAKYYLKWGAKVYRPRWGKAVALKYLAPKKVQRFLLWTAEKRWSNYINEYIQKNPHADENKIKDMRWSVALMGKIDKHLEIEEARKKKGEAPKNHIRCVYSSRAIEAAVSYKYQKSSDGKRSLYVNYVATASWNQADMPRREKYAGSSLFFQVFDSALKNGCENVRLYADKRSQKFYEKLGFTKNGNEMVIEADTMRGFMSKYYTARQLVNNPIVLPKKYKNPKGVNFGVPPVKPDYGEVNQALPKTDNPKRTEPKQQHPDSFKVEQIKDEPLPEQEAAPEGAKENLWKKLPKAYRPSKHILEFFDVQDMTDINELKKLPKAYRPKTHVLKFFGLV